MTDVKKFCQGKFFIGVDPASKDGDKTGIAVINVTDGITFTVDEWFQQMPSLKWWSAALNIPGRVLHGSMTDDDKSKKNMRRYYSCLNARDKKRKRLLRRWRANNRRMQLAWEKKVASLSTQTNEQWAYYNLHKVWKTALDHRSRH